jgi:hypothetical protein
MKTSTTVASQEEAIKMVKEMGKEIQEKASKTPTSYVDLFLDKTTGKIQLPRLTFRGLALMESMGKGREKGGAEQVIELLWILRNQGNPEAFDIPKEDLQKELMELGNSLDFSKVEEYTDAISQAVNPGEPEGNPTSPRPKKRAVKDS